MIGDSVNIHYCLIKAKDRVLIVAILGFLLMHK